MKIYREPARDVPVARDTDVIVVGGGPAGLAAAIASARTGASTVLVEQFGYLGGTATASLMACINGFRNQVEPEGTQVVRGIAEEIVLALKKLGGLGKSPYPQKRYPTEPGQMEYSYAIDTEKFKYVALKTCHDAGVDLMLHTYFCDSIVEDGRIRGVVVENKSGRQALMGRIVVDASGDGDVAARAGAPFWQTVKDEAPRLNDNLMYRIAFGSNRPKKQFACDFGTHAVVWGPGVKAPINGVDADELSRAEVEARLAVYDDFAAKQAETPELADAKLIETPPLLGIRQTRFIEGEYRLTAEDAIEGRRFDDVVAISPCAIINYYGYRRYLEHEGYDIPYRCLVPKKIDNLLVAGRCISSEQQPYESHRAMVNIMAIGQAAGVAAALCAGGGATPRDLDVRQLQRTLIEQGAELRMDVAEEG
ncbi:MAG: FAD-dependent oxidoreductase [Planctomycetes bacterium]|nr:FAD-dependent oxidoreductase [Planctomycetota bacterium]